MSSVHKISCDVCGTVHLINHAGPVVAPPLNQPMVSIGLHIIEEPKMYQIHVLERTTSRSRDYLSLDVCPRCMANINLMQWVKPAPTAP